MKRCACCGKSKPPGDFGKNRQKKDGLHVYCRPCARQKYRDWAAANADHKRELDAAKRERNREKIREQYRSWLKRNPGRDRMHSNAWNARNPKKVRAWVDRRRSRLVDAYVADVDHDAIILRDEGHCGICGDPIMGPIHIDHIIPLAAGGTHEPNNVQCAHASCNLRKWTAVAA